MTKKQSNLDKLFKDDETPKIPVSKKNEASTEIPVKINNFTKHRLFDDPKNQQAVGESIIEVDTALVYIPAYKVDRKNTDLSSIENLAENMEKVGQVQPCTVRLSDSQKNKKYELIFGERRYWAAISKGLKLKVVIKDIPNDSAALMLLSENANREDTTDFAYGEQLNTLLQSEMLTQQDLVEKLALSKQKISRFLSFRKIPEELFNEIRDWSQVSAGTAEKIKQLCSKGLIYQEAILYYAEQIRSGSISHNKLLDLVESKVNNEKMSLKETKKYYTKDGRIAFTVRPDNNGKESFHFPKGVSIGPIAERLLKIMEEENLS